MKNLVRALIINCFIVIGYNSFGQPYRTNQIEFYDYTTVLNDLIENGNKSKYYKNLDYEAMLFLDKMSFKILKKINPKFLIEQNIDTTNIFFSVPEKSIDELQVKFLNIRELFSRNDIWKNIIIQLNRVNLDNKSVMTIDNEIYTKDDQKAIFTIRNESWSITYRVILRNKKLRFEELYEIQE